MTLRRFLLLSFVFTLGLSVAGCDLLGSDDDGSTTVTGVYVSNQGQFRGASGSVTVYDPMAQEAQTSAVDQLGSIVQSIALHDGRLYLAANTGERLDVFSLPDLNQVGQVSDDLPSPRYLSVVDGQTAYVTNLFDDVSVVDLSSNTVTDTIVTGGSPEGITVAEDRAYTALGAFGASPEVAVLDPQADTVSTTINIGCTARFVLADAQDEVFALCNGDQTGQAVVLDGTQVETRLLLADSVGTAGPGQTASYSEPAEELYVVLTQNRIARINTASNTVADTFGPLEGPPIGAVAYSANRQELYVGRVPGFDAAGRVTIHDRDGTQTGSFPAGIAPTYIAVRRN
jgi:YVTN family beta-propeller protein